MARGIALVALCVLVAYVAAEEEELYMDKYDYIDVGAILANDRIRGQYYDCFLGTAPCRTPDAKFFKEKFPEAIVTKCRKCTEKQKEHFEKLVLHYTQKEPEKWTTILQKSINDFKKKSANKQSQST